MTTFVKLTPDRKMTNVRHIQRGLRYDFHQSDMRKCPHYILVEQHYRADGTCKCDDPVEQARMIKDWGYTKEDFPQTKETL